MNNTRLSFGTRGLTLHIQDAVKTCIVENTLETTVSEASAQVRSAVATPVGGLPLAELAKGKRQACIVVSDNTRAAPTPLLVGGVLDVIQEQVPEVRIIVATGLHSSLDQAKMRALVGRRAYACCSIVCHDARNARGLVSMGSSPRGLPILVNRLFVESDLRVLTGLVEPHFMAGYSGGRKSVCPGILGQRSIQFFHSPALLESPRADYGILAGNPVHEEALYVARKVGVDFIVNAALDSQQRVAKVSAGDLEAAWLHCVSFLEMHGRATVQQRFDIVITSNGGYPLDRNYYQAVKGLAAAARIVRPGGIIILAAECRDGLGSDDFRRALRTFTTFRKRDEYLDYIAQEDNWAIDQWEVEVLSKVLQQVSAVFLYSPGISREEKSWTCAEPVSSVEKGLEEARRRLGKGATVAILPNGPYLIPLVAGEEPET